MCFALDIHLCKSVGAIYVGVKNCWVYALNVKATAAWPSTSCSYAPVHFHVYRLQNSFSPWKYPGNIIRLQTAPCIFHSFMCGTHNLVYTVCGSVWIPFSKKMPDCSPPQMKNPDTLLMKCLWAEWLRQATGTNIWTNFHSVQLVHNSKS